METATHARDLHAATQNIHRPARQQRRPHQGHPVTVISRPEAPRQQPQLDEAQLAQAILYGARITDVASLYAIQYARCRYLLHQFCQKAAPEQYQQLDIEAANQDLSSPTLDMLRQVNQAFAPHPPALRPQQLNQAIAKQQAALRQAKQAVCAIRVQLQQLQFQRQQIAAN